LIQLIAVFSGVSFLLFGVGYLNSPRMQAEFSRFGVQQWRSLVGWLQIAGGLGVLAGTTLPTLGGLAAAGLSLMMGFAIALRARSGDPLLQTLPALVYLVLNAFLCFRWFHG
jgi:hypothetical protein